jgi:recombinational DNA repair ATPase RecF
LSKAVTVIQAPNGFGKTSLSEAFEWTLYGEVARKVRSKTKAEFGQEFLRSVHADQADQTWAEVELIKPDGNKLVIRRTMIKGGDNKLEADGKIIESIEDVGIGTSLSSRPCLGQSEIKAFIDTEPKERWKQISAILGLGEFEVIREKLMKLKTDTDRDPTVMQIRESARRAVGPLAPEGVDPLGQDPESLLLQLVTELVLPGDSGWEIVQQTAEKKITDLLSSDKKPASLDQMVTGVEEIFEDGLSDQIDEICNGLKAHREWHDSNKRMKFIGIGLEITNEPECPYCGSNTATPEKVAELTKEYAERDEAPAQLGGSFTTKISEYGVIKTAPVNTAIVSSLIDALADTPDIVVDLTGLQERQGDLITRLSNLGTLARSLTTAIKDGDTTPLDEVVQNGKQLKQEASLLASDYKTLRGDALKTKEKIEGKFKGLTVEERAALEKFQQMKRVATDINYVRQAWEISVRQGELERFVRSIEQGERDTVQALEQELSDDVRDYLTKLSNSKSIQFKRFKISTGVRRQAGLEATAYNKPVNPTSMFSEAQGNCLGLSLYFSQRVNRNPGWHTIILDDPVQSMDDDHKGNLISLLSELELTHQVVVFTHDRAFRGSLAEQFKHHPEYLEYEILKTDKSPVPTIKEQPMRFGQLLNYADICADGPSVQRESAYTALRKAIENLVTGIAVKKKVKLKGADLEQKIKELVGNPLTQTDAGTLDRVRHDCNPNSHDSLAATAPGQIKGFIKDLEKVFASYLA